MKQTHLCQVLAKEWLTEDVFTLVLQRPLEMGEILPSQFFNLKWQTMPYLRRPISISQITEETLSFTIIIKGQGTRQLSQMQVGDVLDVQGPLGNAYQIDPNDKKVLIIGGGIGVPPQAVLTEALAQATQAEIHVQVGFRETPYMLERFLAITPHLEVASEHGDVGYKGYVTDLTEKALERHQYDMIYVCGPHVVIEKVAKLAAKHDTPVQLLMEERMACGIGACMVCTCRVIDQQSEVGYVHKRVCKDGPVFWGSEVWLNA